METVHDLLYAATVVPPVDIQDIYVGCPEFLQGCLNRHMHGLDAVACIMCFLLNGGVQGFVISGVLRGDDELIANLALLHPFTNKFFRRLETTIGCP